MALNMAVATNRVELQTLKNLLKMLEYVAYKYKLRNKDKDL
jgi:hypothetical protein